MAVVTMRAKESAGDFYFLHKLPQRPRQSPLELGEGRVQGEKVTLINQLVHFCPTPSPAPTTSLIRTRCALSYTHVPNAALQPILRWVLTLMTHHCLPSPALVLTWHGRHFLCPYLPAGLRWVEGEVCGDPGLRRPQLR